MSVSNFVPEIWSAAIFAKLRDQLTYASLCNRNYEGEIARAGDTVHIQDVADPAIRSYTKDGGGQAINPSTGANDGAVKTSIQWDLLNDGTRTFTINQADYFAFQVDDIDRRQAMGGFVEEATQGAAYGLASKTDTYVSGLMQAGVDGGNVVTGGLVTTTNAYNLLVALRTKLTRTNTPSQGRWVVVPPEFYGVLLQDDRFIRQDASGTTAGLRNAQVGRAAGFDVIESNVVPEAGGVHTIIAGHDMATTFAEQIAETEALRRETSFSDGVRGLHLYDAKVLRGKQLAKVDVSFDDDESSSSSSSA